MTVTVDGPPGGSLYLRLVGPYGSREEGKTPARTFNAQGKMEIDVEPDTPYRVVIYSAAGVVKRIDNARVWGR